MRCTSRTSSHVDTLAIIQLSVRSRWILEIVLQIFQKLHEEFKNLIETLIVSISPGLKSRDVVHIVCSFCCNSADFLGVGTLMNFIESTLDRKLVIIIDVFMTIT